MLELYVRAGVEWAEGFTHRTIFKRAHVWTLREFPDTYRSEIRLPRGKTRSVESIQYVAGGVPHALTGPSSGSPAGTDYQEDLGGDDGGFIMPPRTGSWPSSDDDVPAPVTVNFTAGWDNADVPSEIIHAILFSVDDALELRGQADIDARSLQGGPRIVARETLVSGWSLTRWY